MAEVLAVVFEGHLIRVTPETPKRAAVLDVFAAMGYAEPKAAWRDLQRRHPELVSTLLTNSPELVSSPATYSFGGRGRPTPVMGEQQLLKLLMVLEGPKAAAFREWASSILFRYLKGDRDLANEIHLRADLLEDGDEALEPQPAEVPPPQVGRPRAIAAQLEAFGAALFAKDEWEQSKDFYDLALRYRALEAEAGDSVSGQRSSPTAPPDSVPESDTANSSDQNPQERRVSVPRQPADQQRAVATRGSTQKRLLDRTRDPLEPELSSKQALFEGWSEISKGAALSVWEALGKYQTNPSRYPRFYRALCRLFGIRTPRESLRWGDELEQELQKRNGDTCQGVFLSRTRGKMPEKNSPRFRIIKQ